MSFYTVFNLTFIYEECLSPAKNIPTHEGIAWKLLVRERSQQEKQHPMQIPDVTQVGDEGILRRGEESIRVADDESPGRAKERTNSLDDPMTDP